MANNKKQAESKNNKTRKQEKKPKKRIPFWLQVTIILLCGVLISGIIFLIAQNKKSDDTEKKTYNKDQHTVTFAYQDGTVIDTKTVGAGKGVYPPIPETDDVFRGWSGPVNNVTSDVEVHPIFYNILEDENLFYFNSVYVKEGEDFSIDIMLTGAVNLSKAELTVSYDSEVMQFVSATDSDICEMNEREKGELILSINSDKPITEKKQLVQLSFMALEKDVQSTQIDLNCKNAEVIEAGKDKPVTVSTINNKIYYLQEVD